MKQHVYLAESLSPRKKYKCDVKPALRFTDFDLVGVDMPHCDALVISAQIDRCAVGQILVDQGASVNILFGDLFRKMGLVGPCG